MKQLKLNDGTKEDFSQRRRARRDVIRNLFLKFQKTLEIHEIKYIFLTKRIPPRSLRELFFQPHVFLWKRLFYVML